MSNQTANVTITTIKQAINDHKALKTLLNMPENIMVYAVIPVGYANYTPPPRPRLSMQEILLRPLA